MGNLTLAIELSSMPLEHEDPGASAAVEVSGLTAPADNPQYPAAHMQVGNESNIVVMLSDGGAFDINVGTTLGGADLGSDTGAAEFNFGDANIDLSGIDTGNPDSPAMVYIEVTPSGENALPIKSYAVRTPAPTISGSLTDARIIKNTGPLAYDTSVGFSGSALSYSVSALSGVSINGATGDVAFDSNILSGQTDTSVTVTATASGGIVQQSLTFSVVQVFVDSTTFNAGAGSNPPTLDYSVTYTGGRTLTAYWATVANPGTPTKAQLKASSGGGIIEGGSFAVTIPTGTDTTNAGAPSGAADEIHFYVEESGSEPVSSDIEVITGVAFDATGPAFSSATTNFAGDTIIVTHDKNIVGTADTSVWTLMINGSPATVGAVSISGADAVLTIGTVAAEGDIITVGYSRGDITDISGNALADYTDESVANNVLDGGDVTVTINVDRTSLQVAPDSVRFSVDLSQADFDTPATHAASGNNYNPQHHDLIYLWNFGDSGDWTAPQNVLPEWKAKTNAKGPWVAHCYTSPGTYTVSLTVIEPSSRKMGTTTKQITVADPDIVYSGMNTICINPNGDSDFTGKPTGAVEVTLPSGNEFLTGSSAWTTYLGGSKKRFLFKRGGTYDAALSIIQTTTNGVYFGAYGSGAKPKFDRTAQGNHIYFNQEYDDAPGTGEARVVDIHFQTGFDPSNGSETGHMDKGVAANCSIDLVVQGCDFEGITSHSVWWLSTKTHRGNVHIDDCTFTKMGGDYPVFYGESTHGSSSFSMTGSRSNRDPNTVSTNTGYRANCRVNMTEFFHMRGCDFFNTQADQPAVKVQESPAEGKIANVHSNSFESTGLACVYFNGNTSKNGGKANNFIFDGNICVSGFNTQNILSSRSQGLTIRNNLLLGPAVKMLDQRLRRFVTLIRDVNPPSYSAPIDIYQNTMACLRSYSQNNSNTVAVSAGSQDFTDVTVNNNINHQPDASMVAQDATLDDDAPLDDSTVLWQSRNTGYYTTSLNASYATPANSLTTFAPLTGPTTSRAIGTALDGHTSYFDIKGQKRPVPPSKGAWEVDTA